MPTSIRAAGTTLNTGLPSVDQTKCPGKRAVERRGAGEAVRRAPWLPDRVPDSHFRRVGHFDRAVQVINVHPPRLPRGLSPGSIALVTPPTNESRIPRILVQMRV